MPSIEVRDGTGGTLAKSVVDTVTLVIIREMMSHFNIQDNPWIPETLADAPQPTREVTGWEQVRPEEREYTEEVRGSEV